MSYLGRRGATAPLNSADIPDDVVQGTDIAYLENDSTTQNLGGTYSTERMYLNDSYTLNDDVTVTGHLALGTIADSDVVITNDSSARTITGPSSGSIAGVIEAGRLMNDFQSSVTGMTGTLGSAVTGSPNLNLTNATFPTGHILQVVTREDLFDFVGATRNNTQWGDIETFTNAITVQKGNKVLFLLQGCKYYTTGTTGHNGNLRAYATDGTNSASGNAGIQQNQNFSLASMRLWGATSSGILTTASGSGTVGVTFSIQGKTDSSGTINYGDTNDDNNGAFILWEVQA